MSISLEEQLWEAWRLALQRAEAEGKQLHRAARRESAELARDWADCVESVRATYAEHFGAGSVGDGFRIPEDYATFMRTNGGGGRVRTSLSGSCLQRQGSPTTRS
jgi:hypothetical protein